MLSNRIGHEGLSVAISELEQLGFEIQHDRAGYIAVRARSDLRWWLLPATWGRVASNSLEMFQPVTPSAAILKRFAKFAAFCGGLIFFPKIFSISGSPAFIRAFGNDGLRYAIFTGTTGRDRKIAIQVMTQAGKILGYVKSSSGIASANLAHEAEMLASLARRRLKSARIPQVIAYGCENGVTYLMTDSMRSSAAVISTVIGRCHMQFLEELNQETVASTESFGSVADRLRARLSLGAFDKFPSSVRLLIESMLGSLGGGKEETRNIFVHGDFTPWNTFLVDGNLYVFDFEYAQEGGLPCEDYFHFVVSQEAIENKRSPSDIFDSLVFDDRIEGLESDVDSRKKLLACYLTKYLMDSFERGSASDRWVHIREVRLRIALLQMVCAHQWKLSS